MSSKRPTTTPDLCLKGLVEFGVAVETLLLAFGVMLRLEEKLIKKSPVQPSLADEQVCGSVGNELEFVMQSLSVCWSFRLSGGGSRKIDAVMLSCSDVLNAML